MTMHVISDFSRPGNFGDRLLAMIEALVNRLDALMTTDPDAYPM